MNLIAKYYEATSGTISIGGKPINHIAAERVLEQVSMVDQDVFLFDDTIRDNIRHARPNATDTEIELPAGRLTVTASSVRWKRDTIRRLARMEIFSLAVSVSEFNSPRYPEK